MIDIKLIREDAEKVKQAVAAKNTDPALVDRVFTLDTDWRDAVSKLDGLRTEQKRLSAERNIEEAKKNKEAIKTLEERAATLEKERELTWAEIPNLPSEDTPVGKDESENKTLRTWGEPPKFDFTPEDHIAIGERLGLIDTEHAAKISGARFNYLKGDAARLEFAIVQFVFETLTDEKVLKKIANKVSSGYSPKPFVPVVPPVMIRPEVFRRMGRLDAKNEDERYYLPKDDLYLIGSAEHTLGPLHMDETIQEKDLPVRYIGFSTAFRREAGSYGKDTKGILRVHQFDKLEMESFTLPEHSRTEQDFIVAIQEYLMQELELPYRVVAVCTGDMGGPDARQIDIETWMPGHPSTPSTGSGQAGSGRGTYRETHTSDMMTDYQSRRLNTKVKRADGKTELVHMNDATAFAIGRILIAILENNQTKDGKVRIPKALQSYVGKKIIGSA